MRLWSYERYDTNFTKIIIAFSDIRKFAVIGRKRNDKTNIIRDRQLVQCCEVAALEYERMSRIVCAINNRSLIVGHIKILDNNIQNICSHHSRKINAIDRIIKRCAVILSVSVPHIKIVG